MKKLHWFVLKSYIGPFILTFFISLFLLLMQFLWKYIDDLVGKGLELPVIGELLFYISLSLVPMALPLAILLASLMTFGNLGENYELLSLKAAGISLQKTMQSLIIFTILVSIGAFFFANNVLPVANLKSRSLLWDVQKQKPDLQIKTGVFYNGIDGYSIRIGEKNQETDLLKKIQVYDHSNGRGNTSVTLADSGYMRMTEDEKNLLLILYNGYTYEEVTEDKKRNRREKTYPHRRDEFKEQHIIIPLLGFGLKRTDQSLFKSNYAMLNLSQLKFFQDSLRQDLLKIHTKYVDNLVRTSYFKKRNRPIQRKQNSTLDSLRFDKQIRQRRINRTLETSKDTATQPIIDALPGDTVKEIETEIGTASETEIQNKPEIEKKDTTFNFYAAYDSLGTDNKTRILYEAVSNARNAKSYVENNNVNIQNHINRLTRYRIEWHRKFTLSFACFIFFFIGAPLGAIIRKGGLGMPVIISVLFFIFYYIITITTYKLAKEGIISPFWGMWLASMILLPTGIFLTYKATTDSVILNIETYTLFFKKIFNIKAKKLTDTETLSTKVFDDKKSNQETINEILDFNETCSNFYIEICDDLKLKNIFNNKILCLKEKLLDYRNEYYSFHGLLTLQNYLDNKHIRSLSQELPTLEVHEYNFLFINRNFSIFLLVFFPLGIMYYFLFLFKSRALKKRLFRIGELTKSILRSAENITEIQN